MPDFAPLISGCQRDDPAAQRGLYDALAPEMLGISLRYSRSRSDAEDSLQIAFVKIFERIGQYRGDGPFVGWVRRVVVTTALTVWRSKAAREDAAVTSWEDVPDMARTDGSALDQLSVQEIMNLIDTLPPGYRHVLNLYAVEGYTHPEIATMLGIAEGTSKSQLARARRLLESRLAALRHVSVPSFSKS